MLFLETMAITFLLLMFVITNHPLVMGLSLMLTSIAMGIMLAQMAPTGWLAYMLVMIFVSGMMIIILYMSSLSSNEITTPNKFTKVSYALMTGALVITSWNNCTMTKNHKLLNDFFTDPLFSIIYKTYTQLMNPATTLIIIYLLIVLVAAVNIVSVSKAPLRSTGE